MKKTPKEQYEEMLKTERTTMFETIPYRPLKIAVPFLNRLKSKWNHKP